MRSLLFVLAFMPSLALAQIPGDYRLDGEDNRDDPYTAEVSISRVQGEWALTRTAIYWKDERRVREPVTWVAAVLRSSDFERPKSVTLQRSSRSNNTLSVFKSRCSTFCSYK